MTLEIPGYYYDTEKKKYFKIEKSSTAPASAAWSSNAVKRRKTEHQVSEVVRKREWDLRKHTKRNILWKDAAVCGPLRREISGWAESWRDLGAVAWAGGLEQKGEVRFGRPRRKGGHLPCMYVAGEEQGLETGVVYTTLDEETLTGSYMPLDRDGKISFQEDAPLHSPRRPGMSVEMVRCPQMSSITYHQGSHRILLTSREPDHSCGLYFFSPPRDDESQGNWLLGHAAHYQRLSIRHRMHDEWLVHNSRPAPPSLPNLICAIATNAGILSVSSDESLSWITPYNPPKAAGRSNKKHGAAAPSTPPIPREVFDLDFHPTNPNLLYAAGRQPRLWLKDMRTPPDEPCSFIRHTSSIARLRAVSENHVLVCGLQNSMTLYDTRFLPATTISSSKNNHHATTPLLPFPSYRNAAHLHLGFDVCPSLHLAAAAQDDGTVCLFSLATGRRLACPALEAGGKMDAPIKALMFQQMPRESTMSLFVGEGMWARKFSFGALDMED